MNQNEKNMQIEKCQRATQLQQLMQNATQTPGSIGMAVREYPTIAPKLAGYEPASKPNYVLAENWREILGPGAVQRIMEMGERQSKLSASVAHLLNSPPHNPAICDACQAGDHVTVPTFDEADSLRRENHALKERLATLEAREARVIEREASVAHAIRRGR